MKEKIAVAGATGVLGKNLIPLLLEENYDVLALARSFEKVNKIFGKNVEFFKCDLLGEISFKEIAEAIKGCTNFIHIATAIPDDLKNKAGWQNNNRIRTEGTKKLLDAVLLANIENYVQQSVVMAYPDCGEKWITEEISLDISPERELICNPVRIMENMVKSLPASSINWVILRGGIFVGKDTFQMHLAEQLKKGDAKISGNGENYISHIHVKDMARAILLSIKSNPDCEIYNIVDSPIKEKKYIEQFAEILNVKPPEINKLNSRLPSFRCSNNKAFEKLNWKPVHNIFCDIEL